MSRKTVNVTLSAEQHTFVKTHGLRISWLLQDAIDEKMESVILSAADILKVEEYLNVDEYMKIVLEFEKRRKKYNEKMTDRIYKRELRELSLIRNKVDKEIKWRKIQMGLILDDSKTFVFRSGGDQEDVQNKKVGSDVKQEANQGN